MENKVATKKCTKCGRVLPLTEYYKVNGRKSNQLRADCKECRKKYTAEYAKMHKEQVNEYARKYNRLHREEVNLKARERYVRKKIGKMINDSITKNYEKKLVNNFKKQLDDCYVGEYISEQENNKQRNIFEVTVYDWMPETQENVLYRCKKCGKMHYGVANEVIKNNFICEECQKDIQKQKQIKRNKFWNFIAKLFHK